MSLPAEQDLRAFLKAKADTLGEKSCLFFGDETISYRIRRRGENISSLEVESVINQHPKVLESAAIPVPAEVGEGRGEASRVRKSVAILLPQGVVARSEVRLSVNFP